MPLSSWMRFSASRSKLFKWLPNESVDLTKTENGNTLNQNVLTVQIISQRMNQSNSHLFPSVAPCCSSIFVNERLLLRTATSKGDNPSLFKLLCAPPSHQKKNFKNHKCVTNYSNVAFFQIRFAHVLLVEFS